MLDFHLNRVMNRKYRNKKGTLQNTGKKAIREQHMIVCEDFENESDEDDDEKDENDLSDNSMVYSSKNMKDKKDRIKYMGHPHIIMQE